MFNFNNARKKLGQRNCLVIEFIVSMILWSGIVIAVLLINHRYGSADSHELIPPFIIMGPLFWFILRFLPYRRRLGKDSKQA